MKQPYLAKLWVLLLITLLGLNAEAQAQTGSVSGRVLDEKNVGIPGATVLVAGTTLGVSSDVDGNFRIANIPAGPQTIVLTFVGYNEVRRPVTIVAGQNVAVDAALTVNATELGEAVVIGYGTQRKQDVTGAITTVTAKDFVQGQITNPEQLIQGKVAGVQITTDGGAPGAGTTIRIRGGSSLNANNNPLIVIDGVPVENPSSTTGNYAVSGVSNPLSLINPNDIETYTVLKDASATAIYGSRASNGVILITTKKGGAGDKLTVNLVSNTSLAARYNSVPVLTADEFRATVQAVAPQQVGLLGTGNTDWQKQIFRTAMTYDNNVSLAGSVGKLPFRASIGNLEQRGILITNSLIRNSGSLSLSPVLLDNHLRVNVNVKGTWVDNNFADAGAIGSALAFDPTQNVFSDNAAYGNYFQYLQGNGTPQQNVPTNPVATLMLQRNRSTVKRSIGNVQLDYKLHFLPDLHANVNLGYDVTRATGTNLIEASSAGSYFNNPRDASNTTARGGSFNYYSQQRNNKLLEAYLNYTKQFSETSRLELLAGYSYQDFVTTAPPYDTYLGDATTVRTLAPPPFRTQYTILSYYGRANLTLNNRYIFTGTLRNDASSRFSPSNRNALFPAGSFAWRIKEENFLKDNKAFSDLKLRVGYGITGQQDVVAAAGSDYPYIQRFQQNVPSAQYQLGGVYYTPYSPLGYNSNLKWEQTSTYNAGLDFGFFDNRLTLSADAYYRKTTDLLAVIPVSALINNTNRLVSNVGSLENKGIELNLNGNVIQSDKLNWSVNANATYNVNRILSLGPQAADFQGIENTGIASGTGTNIGNYRVGSPSSAFYVYQQAYGANGKPVDDVYVDTNGDGKIDATDRRIFQQSAPKVLLGFGSNLSYNRLSLAFSLRANLGNYVYNNVSSNLGNYQGIVGSTNFVANVVRDANNTGFLNSSQARYSSDYYIQNASFLRMDNVTLGYNAGKVLNGKGSLRLSAAVQNVFVATKYTGLDPEIPNGVDNNVYPRPRTYTFGLNLSI